MTDLAIDFLGVHFPNPFCLSSSPVGNCYEMCAKAYETGWGGVVFKTIGPKHFVIREVSPRFDALRKEATPWIGFKNMEQIAEHSLEDNLRDLRRLKENYPNHVLIASIMGTNEEDWVELARLVEEAGELAQSDFSPVAFELGFGGRDGQLPAVTVTEGDETLSVSGKVDRVDGWLHDGKLYLRVVDYKTGKKAFDLSDLRYGLGIQMLLYLFTLEKEGRSYFGYPIVPAGVLYHPAREVILKKDRGIQPEKLQAALQEELRRSGMVLADPEVLRAMEHSALEAPHYLPIRVKKDGSISDGIASAEQLGKLGRYVEDLLHQIAREIGSGNIDADPVARGPQERACDRCDFAAACAFQEGRGGDRVRYIRTVKPEEFWQFVDAENGKEGSTCR